MCQRLLCIIVVYGTPLFSQQLQLHYDPRHWLDPAHNAKNFPTLYFQYFKAESADSSFIKLGSFLLQVQCDLPGPQANIGKFFIQTSQALSFWEPKVFLEVKFSGGLGIAEPGAYGYYITNSYSLGCVVPFQLNDLFLSASLDYSYNAFALPSHDVLVSIYWWKGLCDYTVDLAGDVQFWTQNENQGTSSTANLHGKRISFYGEPQIWFNVGRSFSVGSKVNVYYNILTLDGTLQVYPTLAVRYRL